MTCILASEECPIVALHVGTSNPGSDWTLAGTSSGHGMSLYYKREGSGTIPVGSIYMSYASPCVISSERGGYSRDFYLLEKQ